MAYITILTACLPPYEVPNGRLQSQSCLHSTSTSPRTSRKTCMKYSRSCRIQRLFLLCLHSEGKGAVFGGVYSTVRLLLPRTKRTAWHGGRNRSSLSGE